MKRNNETDRRRLYEKLYRLFDGITPLKTDCGVLCEKACCGGDAQTGMLLFPHEETPLKVTEADGRRLAVCAGVCDRAARPLACRIFPLFPVLDERGRVQVTVDLRGAEICPLARHADEVAFDPRFVRRVKKAGRLLAADPACRAFLRETGAEIEAVAALRRRLTQENAQEPSFRTGKNNHNNDPAGG